MLTQVLDLVFPRRTVGSWMTDEEWERIPRRMRVEEGIDGLPHSLVSATHYHDFIVLRRAIHMLKYRKASSLIEWVGEILYETVGDFITTDTVLCPVPLHWRRKFDRGFNQAELLANYLSMKSGCTVSNLLKRTRNTGNQTLRCRSERLIAVQNAFAYRAKEVAPRQVVLIDDIVTTGATLNACSKVLMKHGVQEVDAWVVARG
ncbi:MAG: ComF family protein [Candidatus Peribacteraceae bacterium]|jgi:ComF family protein|nr:ComF family protein [Candidatus Peribacteraceae bacterium]MDP7476919.1 ComF family protein [Candidatus Peribacteraceae bacterium]